MMLSDVSANGSKDRLSTSLHVKAFRTCNHDPYSHIWSGPQTKPRYGHKDCVSN